MIRTILGAALATAALVLVPAPAAHAEETPSDLCYRITVTGTIAKDVILRCIPWTPGVICQVTGVDASPELKVVVQYCLPNPIVPAG